MKTWKKKAIWFSSATVCGKMEEVKGKPNPVLCVPKCLATDRDG